MGANANLHKAKDAKNDEFYTRLPDLQAEINNYADKFDGKVVFCNCDDPFESNFVKFFLMNFNRLKLKELIATGYKTSTLAGREFEAKKVPYALRVTSTEKYLVGTQKDLDVRGAIYFLKSEEDHIITLLKGNYAVDEEGNRIQRSNHETYIGEDGKSHTKTTYEDLFYEAGDFRSDMSISLLKEADIVCTNPPFSLFIEYMAQLMEHKKKFLIIGNKNAITYKEIFPLIKDNQIWLGYNSPSEFRTPNGITKKINGLTRWFTNLDHTKRHVILPLELGYKYEGYESMYPHYDNYDAVNVDKVSEIPCDYCESWGIAESEFDKISDSWEVVREAVEDGEKIVYVIPKSGTDLRNTLHEHKEGYKEEIEKALEDALADGDGKDAILDGEQQRRCARRRYCNGICGVPITFLDKYSPEQFRIIGHEHDICGNGGGGIEHGQFESNGRGFYKRILINKIL